MHKAVTLTCAVLVCGHAEAARQRADDLQLVWSDEFNRPGPPDPTKWGYDIGGDGWGNDQSEFNSDRRENSRVEKSHLVIEARKEAFASNQYTSARLVSKGPGWRYGRFEIRAKTPRGAGVWPAIWMLPRGQSYGSSYWPDNGEIDIMESFGHRPNETAASFHTFNFNWIKGTQVTNSIQMINLATAYHVFSLDWDEDSAQIAVDGIKYAEFKNPSTGWMDWPFDRPFYLILNVAVGGIGGGEVDDTLFPHQMLVDYVRVYQRRPASRPLATAEVRAK